MFKEDVGETKLEVIHAPLGEKVKFIIGGMQTNFNGQICGIKLHFGDKAFISEKELIMNRIKNTDPSPLLSYAQHKYTVVDGKIDHSIAVNHNPTYVDFAAE